MAVQAIIGPTPAPGVSPYEILAANNSALMNTVNQFGPARQAEMQHKTASEMALLKARLAGEKDIAQWHERAAQIRADSQEKIWDQRTREAMAREEAREKARLNQLSEAEKQQEIRKRVDQIAALGGKIPERGGENESSEGYLHKLISAQYDAQVERNKAHASTIRGYDKSLDALDKAHSLTASKYADSVAPRMFYQQLSTSNTPTDQAALKVMDSLMQGKAVDVGGGHVLNRPGKKMSLEDAIRESGYSDVYSNLKETIAGQHLQNLQKNDRQLLQLQGARDTLAKLYPEADVLATPLAAPSAASGSVPGVDLGILAAAKNAQPGATPAVSPQPNQYLPEALRDPAALSLVAKYHPLGAKLAEDPGDIIGNAMTGARNKVQEKELALKRLGVTVGPNAAISVPTTQPSYALTGSPGVPPVYNMPLSPAERQRRLEEANAILGNYQEAKMDLSKLSTLTQPAQASVAPPVQMMNPAALEPVY